MAAISGLYIGPMYLVAHRFGPAAVWLAVALAAGTALWRTWYRPLVREP
jgi:hypothetical protein